MVTSWTDSELHNVYYAVDDPTGSYVIDGRPVTITGRPNKQGIAEPWLVTGETDAATRPLNDHILAAIHAATRDDYPRAIAHLLSAAKRRTEET